MKQAQADAPDLTPCWEQVEPARKLKNLADIPVLVVMAEASYHAAYDHCTVKYMRQAGMMKTTFIKLADLGIAGNAHMLMLEKNNHDIAAVAEKWMRATVEG